MTTRPSYPSRNANTVLRTLRLMRDLADDMDGDEPDGGGVTVSRLDQVHVS